MNDEGTVVGNGLPSGDDPGDTSTDSPVEEPGVYISEQELNDLGDLLATFRDAILTIEARVSAIETFLVGGATDQGDEPESETDEEVSGEVLPDDVDDPSTSVEDAPEEEQTAQVTKIDFNRPRED